MSITNYNLTNHARGEMIRRQISEVEIAQVLRTPEQIIGVRVGRAVYQSRRTGDETGKVFLLRIFVDIDRIPPDVVTVYRTSKIAKYWKVSP